MKMLPGERTPDITATLKLTVRPKRAAVFLDNRYIGHASEMGGSFHTLLVSPGKHHIRIALPGYRTFETDVNLLAGQKSEVKTELMKRKHRASYDRDQEAGIAPRVGRNSVMLR